MLALLLLGQKFPHAHGIAERTGRGAKLSRPGETRFLTFTPCIAAADAVDRCP